MFFVMKKNITQLNRIYSIIEIYLMQQNNCVELVIKIDIMSILKLILTGETGDDDCCDGNHIVPIYETLWLLKKKISEKVSKRSSELRFLSGL